MKKPDLKTVLGLAITALCLWWVLHDVDWGEVMAYAGRANYFLLAAAAVVATLGIPFRALRWRVLLPPGTETPFEARHAAAAVGFAANNVYPARVGEFARAFTMGRLAGLPLGTVFGSLVLERVFDGMVIVGLLFLAMSAPSFPDLAVGSTDPRLLAWGVGAVAGGLGLACFLLALFPTWSLRVAERAASVLPQSFRRPVIDALHSFVKGLAILRSPRRFAVALAWAVAQWLFTAVSYLLALRSFGITTVDFVGAVFVQSVVSVAVAVPSAPGFFGPYQAASKIGLAPWGIPEEQVVAYAIWFNIAGWLPVTLLGAFFVWKLKLSWSDVRGSEEKVEEAVEHDPELTPPDAREGRGA